MFGAVPIALLAVTLPLTNNNASNKDAAVVLGLSFSAFWLSSANLWFLRDQPMLGAGE
ncbi:MAG TPA: hypothetical protein VLT58_12085 [Polyangia bacterium]|nr:hypothetical protein [Polyangia bacterium]